MRSVGIRELRQRASELLRQVGTGESVVITDRGRPVAVLGPVPSTSVYERLVAEGRIVPAFGQLHELPDPRPAPPGAMSTAQVLDELGEDRL